MTFTRSLVRALLAAAFLTASFAAATQADPGASPKADTLPRKADDDIGHVCDLIAAQAGINGLPPDFFARLIWKESRFDADAVSPVGAEGIAQFMPGTAKQRGLADSFDVEQAIPASAAYLAHLRTVYGNLGLAAAAYNAGEARVSRWLSSGGFLPLETEGYVLAILGEPVDNFAERSHKAAIPPLKAGIPFGKACRTLPVTLAATIPMSRVNVKPWGVQVAGNFRRSAALRQWKRVRARFPKQLSGHEPVISHVRSPLGRRGIYAVRIGANSRAEADAICRRLHGAGGACVVLRNR